LSMGSRMKPSEETRTVRVNSGLNGGAIIDHMPPRERRLVAVQK
jgi:hypothetical protein